MVSGGRGSRRGGCGVNPNCTGENSMEWIAPAMDVIETRLLRATQRMSISATGLLHNLRGLRNVQAADVGHHVCIRGRIGRFETEILATLKECEVLVGRAGEVDGSRCPTPLPRQADRRHGQPTSVTEGVEVRIAERRIGSGSSSCYIPIVHAMNLEASR